MIARLLHNQCLTRDDGLWRVSLLYCYADDGRGTQSMTHKQPICEAIYDTVQVEKRIHITKTIMSTSNKATKLLDTYRKSSMVYAIKWILEEAVRDHNNSLAFISVRVGFVVVSD